MALSSRGASQPQGFALPWTAAIHAVSSHQFIESANVAAKIVGSDPVLRNQYVIYTAHLDHLGICPPVEGDNVCHGTIDNASGVSTSCFSLATTGTEACDAVGGAFGLQWRGGLRTARKL
jgi:Zn-dependent M28 family amino/carboxypeptidase